MSGSGRLCGPTATGITIADAATGRIVKTLPSREGPYVADGITDPATGDLLTGAYKRFERRRPDGRLVWSYDSLFNYCQAAAVLDGNDLVFGAWDTYLRCIDARTGRLRWASRGGVCYCYARCRRHRHSFFRERHRASEQGRSGGDAPCRCAVIFVDGARLAQ